MRRFLLWSSVVLLVLVVGVLLVLAFPPERWIADRAERIARETSGYALEIGSLDLDLLSLTPSATVADVTLEGAELDGLLSAQRAVAAVDLKALLGGRVLVDRIALTDAEITVRRDADGRTTWAAADVAPSEAPTEPSDEPPTIPAIRDVSIDGLRVVVDDAGTGRTADLTFAAAGSTLPDSAPVTLDVDGTVDGVDAAAALEVSPLGDVLEIDSGLALDLVASLGEIALTGSGRVGRPGALDDIELALTLEAASLDALATLLRTELPAFEPVTFAGTVLRERDAEEFVLRRFDLATGGTTLQGDVRADPSTAPPTLYANLISNRLDVDALQAVLLGEAMDGETTPAEADEPVAPGARVLPDATLPVVELFGLVQGAVEFRAVEIVAEGLPLDSIELTAELGTERIALDLVRAAVADGSVTGSVLLEDPNGATPAAERDPAGSPVSATLELELSRLDVGRLLRAADLPDDAGGRLGGKAKYWSEGASVASLAADLDGGTFLLMDGGELAAVLIELAGIDLFQSLGDLLVPGEDPVNIRCAYADIHSEDGLTGINEFVIDTEDTVFLATGEIDLAEETLAVAFEPHPKDASLVASSTPVEVRGTFAAPDVDIGAELPVRAAAVAALAALAAPALALLPLIEIGGGDDSPYCSGLEGALDDA